LAGEYAKNRIRANAICPGLVKTDRVMRRFGDPNDVNSGRPQPQAMNYTATGDSVERQFQSDIHSR